jgi:tetratricopeptide (TPR) repeat protein
MDVSVITADRILAGKRADRATLLHAFDNLNLAWNDNFLEQDGGTPGPAGSVTHISPKTSTRSRDISILIVAIFLALAIGIRSQSAEPRGWRNDLNDALAKANAFNTAAQYQRALEELQPALLMARQHEAAGHLASALQLQGELHTVNGAYSLANQSFSEAILLRELTSKKDCVIQLELALADVLLRQNESELSETHVRRALQLSLDLHNTTGIAMANRDLALLLLARDQGYRARESMNESLKMVVYCPDPALKMDIRASSAELLLAEGKINQARATLNECLAYWKEHQQPRWTALMKLKLARVEIAAQQSGAAQMLLFDALAMFKEVGDTPRTTECKNLLDRLSG